MNRKEHKGGILTNQEIEEELQRTGQQPENQPYRGSQDNGDTVVRELGTEVQQNDGTGEEDTPE
ncbi:hypothetical protein SAMN05444008_107185 [Cnuella takakiae]|uniref:Uncharacterized protein n=1 Tax=Cnuella takakiae TaxID=1302690 RepID=A0A1M5B7Y0_9BACT|nr:hypothetical protein [Cnuella takakiae]OLY93368.1 hypothetical protein BUE76_16890 [Cnuella takakiae]SHF38545.1 hypothetical protein SAMN05444008_107185 [Cnuella takakiae]